MNVVNYWVNDDDRAAGIENMTLWILNGDPFAAVVTDDTGTVVECGHARPVEIANRLAAQREKVISVGGSGTDRWAVVGEHVAAGRAAAP